MIDQLTQEPEMKRVFTELLTQLDSDIQKLEFESGNPIHQPNDAATDLFLIHEGQVRTYWVDDRGNEQMLGILGADDWFGWAALSGQPHYNERAVAIDNAVVSRIPSKKLAEHLAKHPAAAVEISNQLARQLTFTKANAASLIFDDCDTRILKTLLRFTESAAGSREGDQAVVRVTHEQLALAVGAARETVSLALIRFRQENLIRTGRNMLIFDPARLENAIASRRPAQTN